MQNDALGHREGLKGFKNRSVDTSSTYRVSSTVDLRRGYLRL